MFRSNASVTVLKLGNVCVLDRVGLTNYCVHDGLLLAQSIVSLIWKANEDKTLGQ